MMKLNKDLEYALIALVKMAEDNRVYSAREISEHFNIPYELLSKVLQRLVRMNIALSIQGAQGGYRIARPIGEITLFEVVRAVQGQPNLVPCLSDHRNCVQKANCNISESLEHLQTNMMDFFGSLTVQQLVEMPHLGHNLHETSLTDD